MILIYAVNWHITQINWELHMNFVFLYWFSQSIRIHCNRLDFVEIVFVLLKRIRINISPVYWGVLPTIYTGIVDSHLIAAFQQIFDIAITMPNINSFFMYRYTSYLWSHAIFLIICVYFIPLIPHVGVIERKLCYSLFGHSIF